MYIAKYMSRLWFKGLAFLYQKDIPDFLLRHASLDKSDPELRAVCLVSTAEYATDLLDRLSYFSSWFKAKRAVANSILIIQFWRAKCKNENAKLPVCPVSDLQRGEILMIKEVQVFHFKDEVSCLKGAQFWRAWCKNENAKLPVCTVSDLQRGEILMIKEVQIYHFKDEVSCLKGGTIVHCNSKLLGLCSIIDDNGGMRVGGRLDHASTLSYIEKHPIVMSRAKDGKVSKLIIIHYHEKLCIRAEVLL